MSVGMANERLNYLQNYALKIFNFEEVFDLNIFDELIRCLYHGDPAENEFSQKILEQFISDDRSWQRVDTILELSSSDESRFFALLILEKLIKSRWKVLPNEQRIGIRDYIVQQIIAIGSLSESFETRKLYLNKLVCVLVEILKYEWPRRWPEFIDEIVQSSKISENIALVNMKILRLLSEEIFIYSSQMNHIKTKLLSDAFVNQFSSLYSHMFIVLTESTNIPLITECLQALTGFIQFIPKRYAFQTSLIDLLLERFFKEPVFSNDTLACLSEIMAIDDIESILTKRKIYATVLDKMKQILPFTFDFNLAFTHGSDVQQRFLRMLSMFFTQSLKDFLKLCPPANDNTLLVEGLEYVHAATKIKDTEIFKICIEFWKQFTLTVRIDSSRSESRNDYNMKHMLEAVGVVLAKLRFTIITHMQRPEEVIIFVNEHGEVVRQFMRDTDSIALYTSCKETLTNLTILNPEDVKSIIYSQLDTLMTSPNFSWNDLNCVGWAVGSISGSMTVDMERDFLVRVLRNLLALCDEKQGKDNKALIASNIMYVVQNYPRFLKPFPRFLKTVVNKLFEFMLETHEGVQDMACDAFLKISRLCKFQLAKAQADESFSYIDDCIPSLHSNICLLNVNQLETVFEALGTIISAIDDITHAQEIIMACLQPYVAYWASFISSVNTPQLQTVDFALLYKVCTLFKISASMCKSVGEVFEIFVERVYSDVLVVYKQLSTLIASQLVNLGVDAAAYSEVKAMRGFRRDALNMVEIFISKHPSNLDMVKTKYFIPFVSVVLTEYLQSYHTVRDSEVLSATSVFVTSLKSRINDQIIIIFQNLFDSTLSMINRDLIEFPEHRTHFFRLIQAIIDFCFSSLITLNPAEFDFIMQSLFFGISHTTSSISSIAISSLINILGQLVNTFNVDIDFVSRFYQTYYISIIDRICLLITDSVHVSDFAEHAFILSHLFNLLDNGKIPVSLSPEITNKSDNQSFVKNHIVAFLKHQYPHLSDQHLCLFFDGLMCFYSVHEQFMQHMRDFLLQLKEYQGDLGEDLFEDEIKKEMRDVMVKRFQDFSLPSDKSKDYRSLHDYHTTA